MTSTHLTESEREFLLAEFNQAWSQVLNIDERRFKFVEYYSAITAGLLAVSVNLAIGERRLSVPVGISVTVLMVAGVVIGLSFVKMILSERQANVRYRQKINVIRGIFVGQSDNEGVRAYLSRKDLGVKVMADPQPEGIGRTLRWVFVFMGLEMAVMSAAAIAVWLGIILHVDLG